MKTTTLYSLNLVQLDYLSIRFWRLIPLLKAGRADGNRSLVTGAAQAGSFRQFCGLHLVATGNFIINPAGLNTAAWQGATWS